MTRFRLNRSASWMLLASLLGLGTVASSAPSTPSLTLEETGGSYYFLVRGITAHALQELAVGADLDRLLIVHLNGMTQDIPPLLGRVEVENQGIAFHPRYPLQPGATYVVRFRPGPGKLEPLDAEFTIPPADAQPAAEIVAVYPTSNRVPENLLKFYIYFSRSMSRGDVYRHIRLFHGGEEVDLPFLEIEQELWDTAYRRLTLLIDPGRIKRGLLPNEEVGTALMAGENYRLVIDREWPDASGAPLRRAFEKRFLVTAADRSPPDPKRWDLKVPEAGTGDPLRVGFGKPMDQAMVLRLLHVIDASGTRIPGKSALEDEESIWLFQPDQPWRPGAYSLAFSKLLEDLAGNRIGRPFDVDVFEPVQKRIVEEVVHLPFQIPAGR